MIKRRGRCKTIRQLKEEKQLNKPIFAKIDATIELHKQAIDKLETLKASVLHRLIEGSN